MWHMSQGSTAVSGRGMQSQQQFVNDVNCEIKVIMVNDIDDMSDNELII